MTSRLSAMVQLNLQVTLMCQSDTVPESGVQLQIRGMVYSHVKHPRHVTMFPMYPCKQMGLSSAAKPPSAIGEILEGSRHPSKNLGSKENTWLLGHGCCMRCPRFSLALCNSDMEVLNRKVSMTSPPPQTGPSRHANSLHLPPHRIHSPDLHGTLSPDAHQPHLDPANPAGIPDSPESTLPELTPLPPVPPTPDMQQDTEDPRLRLYLLGTNRKLPSLEENTPCAGPLVTSFCKPHLLLKAWTQLRLPHK
ncbi:hypothetical protein M405DRAFT_848037 [Rhizopogon salebrosus TDB-379]|nr:hypothetical protein M405DRAFT_848037 [Rhizopogon salebrosus TDB-379]